MKHLRHLVVVVVVPALILALFAGIGAMEVAGAL